MDNKNYLKQVKELQTKSHPKTRLLQFVYKQLKVKPPINNFSRGVYFLLDYLMILINF